MALDNLALVHQSLTNYSQAIALHHQALHVARTMAGSPRERPQPGDRVYSCQQLATQLRNQLAS